MNFYLTPHQTAALITVHGVNTKKALDQIEAYKTKLLLRSAFGWNREQYNQLDLEYQIFDHLMKNWHARTQSEVDFISEEIRRTAGIILRDLQKIDRG